jgi:hypothetical protein
MITSIELYSGEMKAFSLTTLAFTAYVIVVYNHCDLYVNNV